MHRDIVRCVASALYPSQPHWSLSELVSRVLPDVRRRRSGRRDRTGSFPGQILASLTAHTLHNFRHSLILNHSRAVRTIHQHIHISRVIHSLLPALEILSFPNRSIYSGGDPSLITAIDRLRVVASRLCLCGPECGVFEHCAAKLRASIEPALERLHQAHPYKRRCRRSYRLVPAYVSHYTHVCSLHQY